MTEIKYSYGVCPNKDTDRYVKKSKENEEDARKLINTGTTHRYKTADEDNTRSRG